MFYCLKLQVTVCSYKKLAIFTTNVDAVNKCLINYKCVCGVLNRQFFVGAVIGSCYSNYFHDCLVLKHNANNELKNSPKAINIKGTKSLSCNVLSVLYLPKK